MLRENLIRGDSQGVLVAFGRSEAALLHGLEKGTEPPSPGPGLCYSVALGHPKLGHSVENFARQLYLDPVSVEGPTSHTSADDRLETVHGILDHASPAIA